MGLLALAVVILLWISVILVAHEYLPGSIGFTNALFGVALVATYFCCWSLAAIASNSPRLMFIRAVATTLVVMMSLLILELPAMVKLVDWSFVMQKLSGEKHSYTTTFIADKDLAFRRIPNLHWSGRPSSDLEEKYLLPRTLATPITFTYDRWGYRNTTDMERASIVLIGDSFVEGWYVSDEQTVASRLAHRLAQCVANLGVAGYGPMQEVRVLKGDALGKKPKVIAWFFFEGNDLYDDHSFERFLAAPQHWELEANNWQRRSFTINAARWIRRWTHSIVPNRAPFWAIPLGHGRSSKQIYFVGYGAVPWTEYEEGRWERAQKSFRDGIEVARASGVEIILLYVPIKFRVYRQFITIPPHSPMRSWDVWPLPQKFEEFCRSVSVPCVDLTDRLQQAVREGVDVYAFNDTHWSSEGHAVVAAELDRVLRGLDWVSLHQSSSYNAAASGASLRCASQNHD
jgi:hypothetical protein